MFHHISMFAERKSTLGILDMIDFVASSLVTYVNFSHIVCGSFVRYSGDVFLKHWFIFNVLNVQSNVLI